MAARSLSTTRAAAPCSCNNRMTPFIQLTLNEHKKSPSSSKTLQKPLLALIGSACMLPMRWRFWRSRSMPTSPRCILACPRPSTQTAGLSEGTFREARRFAECQSSRLRTAWLFCTKTLSMKCLSKVVNRDYAESLGSKAAGAFTGRSWASMFSFDQKIVATGDKRTCSSTANAIVMANRPLPSLPPRWYGCG